MIYVRQPTDEEREELQRMTRQAVGRVSQRARMVLLSSEKRTVPKIADIFHTSEATVRFWMRRFDAEGPDGLYDETRSGRPRKVNQSTESTLVKMVESDPQQAGYQATFWTVGMLVLALVNKGVQVSGTCVRATLHRIGLHWGRPRLAMPKKVDPDKAAKQWAIVQAMVKAGPEAAILYADESRIHLLPLIRAMWHWAGQQIRVPTPGTNETRALFGALNIRTGRWVCIVREHMFKEDFIAFLEHLLIAYPSGPILLIVDNYSSHTAGVVAAWLTEHSRLQLLYLPKYCSHLNPVEQIWLRLKDTVAANRLHGSMKTLLATVETFFTEMTQEKALVWAAA